MSAITNQSLEIATQEASRLWAYAGAQYVSNRELRKEISFQTIKSLSQFSLSARRILKKFPKEKKFHINANPWNYKNAELETDLWESLSLVIHAQELKIQFSSLNEGVYAKDAGVITHATTSTDRKKAKMISPFGMAYSFLSEVLPEYIKL